MKRLQRDPNDLNIKGEQQNSLWSVICSYFHSGRYAPIREIWPTNKTSCWAIAADGGQTLNHWLDVSCLIGFDLYLNIYVTRPNVDASVILDVN